MVKAIIPIALIIILSFLAFVPLFQPGYFPMHDDTQPARVYEMQQALSHGQLPVRWVRDLGFGYGYPIFNFYAPLPYYVGAASMFLQLDAIIATKFMMFSGFLLAAISMFFLARYLWGSVAGMLAALLYMYAPYHAVQLYVRGSIGEVWAYGFIPLVFLGILLTKKNLRLGLILGSISFAAVILSHNITGFLLIGFLLAWLLIELIKKITSPKNSNYLFPQIIIIFLGLSLSAFFWLPALYESPLTQVQELAQGTNDFRDHFLFIDQLWNSPWGYAGSAPGRLDGMSFMIGKIHVALVMISLIILCVKTLARKDKSFPKILFLLAGLVISIFMTLQFSQFLWELIPLSGFIQYPWRFLMFINFFSSLLAAAVITNFQSLIKNKNVLYVCVGFQILFLILFNQKYFRPQFIYQPAASDYISQTALNTKLSEISYEYLPKDFPIPQNNADIATGQLMTSNDIIVQQEDLKTHVRSYKISAPIRTEIIFSIAHFPGWKYVVDGKYVEPTIKNGLPTITVESGDHIVTALFTDTWIRMIGNSISIIAFLVLLVLIKRHAGAQR